MNREAHTQGKWGLGAHEERAACGRLREGDNPDKTGPGRRGVWRGSRQGSSAVPTGSTAGRKAVKSVVTK
jgi:hypothetical protein